MGGYFRKAIIAILTLLMCRTVADGQGHGGHRVVWVDQNYKEVSKEKDAVYQVDYFDYSDTVYFETRSLSPKGLIEKGKYPLNQGFDLRNCFITRLWPNGNLRAQGELKNSWNEGIWKYYDESGQLYSEVEFHTGLMTGQAKRFYDGIYTRTYTYEKNIRNGESSYFDTSGHIIQVCSYLNDSLHGLWVEYYPNGVLKRKTQYQHGLPVKDSWYYETGMPYNTEQFDEKGEWDGRCFMYTPKGKIARFDEYKHGELLQNDCRYSLADPDWTGDDCPPRLIKATYPGGLPKYMEWVSLNQEYPETAIQWKQQGIVIYEFTIDANGFMENITQENIVPAGFGLEKESLRLLKKMIRFKPERLNGKAIPVRMQMPYVFILQD